MKEQILTLLIENLPLIFLAIITLIKGIPAVNAWLLKEENAEFNRFIEIVYLAVSNFKRQSEREGKRLSGDDVKALAEAQLRKLLSGVGKQLSDDMLEQAKVTWDAIHQKNKMNKGIHVTASDVAENARLTQAKSVADSYYANVKNNSKKEESK